MAHYNSEKPFLKRVLIPFWVVQIFLSALLLAISIWGIVVIEDYSDSSPIFHIFSVGAVILLAFSAVSLIIIIAEIILFAKHSLTPTNYLICNCITFAIWLAYFALGVESIIVVGSGSDIIFASFFLAAFLGTFIYAIVLFSRQRKSAKYERLNMMHTRNVSSGSDKNSNVIRLNSGNIETIRYDPYRHPEPETGLCSYEGDNKHNINSTSYVSEPHFGTSDTADLKYPAPLFSQSTSRAPSPANVTRPMSEELVHPALRQQYEPLRLDAGEIERRAEESRFRELEQMRGTNNMSPSSVYTGVEQSLVSPVDRFEQGDLWQDRAYVSGA